MAPVIMSVTMFSLLLLMMMINVVQCTTLAVEVYKISQEYDGIDHANGLANQLAQPDAYYIGSNKEHLIEQIRTRIRMTQSTIEQLTKLYEAKFGDITKWPEDSKEFDPDDQVKAKPLLDKLKESRMWFGNLFRLFDYQNELKKHYSTVKANEKLLQEGIKMMNSSSKLAHQTFYIEELQIRLNKVKQTLDKVKPIYGHELDILATDVVEHNLKKKFEKDEKYSAYRAVKDSLERLTNQCEELQEKLDDQLLLAASDNDESDVETPQDDEQLKEAKAELRNRRTFREQEKLVFKNFPYHLGSNERKQTVEKNRENLKNRWKDVQEAKRKVKEAKQNSASIQTSNSSGPEKSQEKTPILSEPGLGENQEKVIPPVIPPVISNNDTQSFQGDERPFWKKKRYNIPASIAGITLFGGWMLDLHNIIPQMIWGSKENDASTKVNPPNSTTTDTSTDAPTHQVEYLTVVIIVLVVLVLLAAVIAVLLKRHKNGTSDLELGKPSHKSQAASTMVSTITGTETPLTPTRSTNATSSKAKSKKDSPGTASTPVSSKTKSKRSSQK